MRFPSERSALALVGPLTDAKTQCFACHQGQEKTDFVFSSYRR
jgi:hypothetical protein